MTDIQSNDIITPASITNAAEDLRSLETLANALPSHQEDGLEPGQHRTRLNSVVSVVSKVIADIRDKFQPESIATEASLIADLVPDAGTLRYAEDTQRLFIKIGNSGVGSWQEFLDLTVGDRSQFVEDAKPAARRAYPSSQTGNNSTASIPQADGFRRLPTAVETSDYDLPAGTGEVTIYMPIQSGAANVTYTELDALDQVVNSQQDIVVPLVSEAHEISFARDAATTRIRVSVLGTAAGSYKQPSVTLGTPVVPPDDVGIVGQFLKNIGTGDGTPEGRLTAQTGQIVLTGDDTFTIPAGRNDTATYTFDRNIDTSSQVTVRVSISGGTLNAPAQIALRRIDAADTDDASEILMSVETSAGVYEETFDANVSNMRLSGFKIRVRNDSQAPQRNLTPEALTLKVEAFESANIPAVRHEPAIITQAREDRLKLLETTILARVDEMFAERFQEYILGEEASFIAGVLDSWRSKIDMYVDPVLGDDANDGLSPQSPKRTRDAGYTALLNLPGTDRKVLGLTTSDPDDRTTWHRGDIDTIGASALTTRIIDVVSYGQRGSHAIWDAALYVGDATWTQVAGTSNVWTATVTHREVTTDNDGSIDADATHYEFAEGPTILDWRRDGLTVAATTAAIDANPGSWGVTVEGQTNTDPRQASVNGTNHVYYLHLPDGSDPNGADIYVADRNVAFDAYESTLVGIEWRGFHGKDGAHAFIKDRSAADATSENLVTLINCKVTGTRAHGIVGPSRIIGRFDASGRNPEGINETSGRSSGGAWHCFSDTDYPNVKITLSRYGFLNIENFGISAQYQHTTGSGQLYDSFVSHETARWKVRNCSAAITLSGTSDGGNYRNGYTASNIDAEDVDIFVSVGANDNGVVIKKGSWKAPENSPGTQRNALCRFFNGGGDVTIEDVEFEHRSATPPQAFLQTSALLAIRQGAGDPPTLRLTRVTDNTSLILYNRKSMMLQATLGGVAAGLMDLHFTDCVLGDLQRNSTDTLAQPNSFTVTNSTFGFGNRDSAEIIALVGNSSTIGTSSSVIGRAGLEIEEVA